MNNEKFKPRKKDIVDLGSRYYDYYIRLPEKDFNDSVNRLARALRAINQKSLDPVMPLNFNVDLE